MNVETQIMELGEAAQAKGDLLEFDVGKYVICGIPTSVKDGYVHLLESFEMTSEGWSITSNKGRHAERCFGSKYINLSAIVSFGQCNMPIVDNQGPI